MKMLCVHDGKGNAASNWKKTRSRGDAGCSSFVAMGWGTAAPKGRTVESERHVAVRAEQKGWQVAGSIAKGRSGDGLGALGTGLIDS